MLSESQLEVNNEYNNKNDIPIKNIYYMLSYAFRYSNTNKDIKRECENFNNIHDLFARILIEGVNSLIRRGFYKEYGVEKEDISTIRGKINITESIKRQTLIYKKLNCEYDDFSENVLFNQIIKTTIHNLIRYKFLNKDLKKDLSKLTYYFDSVSLKEINKQDFDSVRWNRNNQYYMLIIHICKMLFKLKLPDDGEKGKIRFKDFIKNYDKEMAALF